MVVSSLLDKDRPDVLFLKEAKVTQLIHTWPQFFAKNILRLPHFRAASLPARQLFRPRSKYD